MLLFLIRHDETVDNVAGLYAGSRDSALTVTGIQQARRLGTWLAENRPPLTHVFTSPLQRADKTAQAIASAQNHEVKASTVKVDQLVEQDFGYYEGKPFYARTRDSPKKTGREAHYDSHKDDPGFVDVESKDSLAKRSDAFLDTHLLPLFDGDESPVEHVVVVVSHGILLSNLWRRLLLRLPRKSVPVAPEVVTARGQLTLEHLGGWSNTGFLEISIRRGVNTAGSRQDNSDQPSIAVVVKPSSPQSITLPPQTDQVGDSGVGISPLLQEAGSVPHQALPTRHFDGCTTMILNVDGKHHLQGFKRTRGGIGRIEYDEKQKTMDSFFKRAKKE
ncbi:histidine phosphatase superfamily [Delphinella strobiligena]|nr:histidine phosphatase superfamily [Delphinella strobiligena]